MAAARLITALLCATTAYAIQPRPIPYTVGYFSTRLDHSTAVKDNDTITASAVGGSSTSSQTFKLKYLYDYSSYRSGGPIFFHCGGQESAEAAARRIVNMEL